MGGTQNSFSPQASGYQPVNLVQRNGQYYHHTPAPLTHPIGAKMNPEARPQGTYTPINFGGGQQSGGRYGAPRKYGTPNSSYRAPATYRNTPAPSYGGGQGGKGGYEAPPPRSYQQPSKYPASSYGGGYGGKGGVSPAPQPPSPQPQNDFDLGFGSMQYSQPSPSKYQQPKLSYKAQVPSFDPDNPQEDAVKDPKLKKAAKQLNKQAPPGERLAFINPQEEAVLKALGGSGMTAAGGIPSYKKGDVEAPPPRDYGAETRDTLQAQVELAPELFAKEAEFRPQYANLERGIMLEQMGLDPNIGLLDAFRTISGAQKDIQRDSTIADIDMIGGLGQQFAEAVRSADPRAEGLRQSIMGEAEQGLAQGAGEFGEVADYQRQRLQANQGAYAPLMDRAEAGLSGGAEYDALVNEAQQARESNPYDQLVSDAQAKRGEDPYARLRDKSSARLDADPYAEVTANAKASLGQDPFGNIEQMASERLQSNPYDELQADARSRMDSNPFAEIVGQAREDYLSGEGLSALESRDLDQRVLEGAASRGMEDSSSTLADQIGQRLSADRGIRNQRRDALSQALGMSEGYDRRSLGDYTNLVGQGDEYRRAGMQDYTGVKTLQDDYQRGKLGDYTNLIGQGDQYQRGGMQDFATAEGLSQDYDRTATSDYAQALGQQEGYSDRGLNRFTSALGQREDFGRRMEQDYAGALSGRTGLEAALMGDYERSLANQQSARQQGLQNASAAYAMGNFDPLMALTGRSGTAPMMAQQGFGGAGFALDSSPAIFNPESSYAGSLAASNQQNIMDARTATAANRAGMFGGLMGGLGSFAGGFFR